MNKFLLFEAGELASRWQQGQGTLVIATGVPGLFQELPGRFWGVGAWLSAG